MMIPAVVLALVLVVPTFSLPLSTEESVSSGIQGTQIIQESSGIISQPITTGEKTGIQGVSQITQGIIEGTKTGVEVPTGVVQNVENPVYPQVEQAVQPVVTQVYSGTPVQYAGLETTQQVEKTGAQVPSEGFTSQQYPLNTVVPKVENVPVQQQLPVQTPLLLPVQPLNVVPVNQVGELLQPVVVPEEPVTAGRVIVMAIEPIQQRQDVVPVVPEQQVPYQQIVQPVNPVQTQGVQPLFVQPVQTQKPQPVSQTYIPVQVQPEQTPFVKEQYNPNVEHQIAESVQSYNPAEHTAHVYNVQPSQVVNEYVGKQQVPQQNVGYTAGQTQYVEGTQQQSQIVQSIGEKQGEFQHVSEYTPVQNQGVQTLYQQQNTPVENVQVQQEYQQQQQLTSVQQPIERQTPYQQVGEYIPVQNQQSYVQPQQQVYNVQPEHQQNYEPVQTPIQQQVYNVQPEYHQQSLAPTVEQTQNVQQTFEKQVPHPQQIQTAQYTQPQEVPYQQPVSNVQQFSVTQVETLVPSQQVQQENYVPLQKTTEVQQPHQQVLGAQPVYNFGDRIPQSQSVQQTVLSGVVQSVQPSVVSTQA